MKKNQNDKRIDSCRVKERLKTAVKARNRGLKAMIL